MIHLTQNCFRGMLHAMSYVGEIAQLAPMTNTTKELSSSQLVAATLLDAETPFIYLGNEQLTQRFATLFAAPITTLEQADYIFVTADQLASQSAYLQNSKIGTLENPHMAATICVACSCLQPDIQCLATGPGINIQKMISLPQLILPLLLVREQLNIEYPLGVDIIIFDDNYQVLCLPRTTTVIIEH